MSKIIIKITVNAFPLLSAKLFSSSCCGTHTFLTMLLSLSQGYVLQQCTRHAPVKILSNYSPLISFVTKPIHFLLPSSISLSASTFLPSSWYFIHLSSFSIATQTFFCYKYQSSPSNYSELWFLVSTNSLAQHFSQRCSHFSFQKFLFRVCSATQHALSSSSLSNKTMSCSQTLSRAYKQHRLQFASFVAFRYSSSPRHALHQISLYFSLKLTILRYRIVSHSNRH